MAATVPPIRLRPGTTRRLSTVANTAFSSGTADDVTSKSSSAACALVDATPNATSTPIAGNNLRLLREYMEPLQTVYSLEPRKPRPG